MFFLCSYYPYYDFFLYFTNTFLYLDMFSYLILGILLLLLLLFIFHHFTFQSNTQSPIFLLCIYLCIYVFVYLWVYVFMCLCRYACMYVFIYTISYFNPLFYLFFFTAFSSEENEKYFEYHPTQDHLVAEEI